MKKECKKNLQLVKETLAEAARYEHASAIISYDRHTIAPRKAMAAQGDLEAYFENIAYRMLKDKAFLKACDALYKDREQLDDKYDLALIEALHRDRLRTKKITPKMQKRYSEIYNRAYADWLSAKEEASFPKFLKSLKAVRDIDLEQAKLKGKRGEDAYDTLLDNYERGMKSAILDETFGECKERLIPLLEKINKSGKEIRTDFLTRRVDESQQIRMAKFLLDRIGFDMSRGAFTTTEHPFMDDIAIDDIRLTTHYYDDNFTSSMFSILHEGGHALFGQNTPKASYEHFIRGEKTFGMHESVSRFYENRIGRSLSFIESIYDGTKEIFPQIFGDVTVNEFYEAVNKVTPSLIRIEADEFTYTFHIIIRYEIEKEIVSGKVKLPDLPEVWNDRYEKYLGVRPSNDREGVLQDMHWSSGFGYFPTYALGNMYNAMYYNKMRKKIDIDACVRSGDLSEINAWMKRNVFKKADLLEPAEWIKDITGRDFTPRDYLDYLEDKYGELYGL